MAAMQNAFEGQAQGSHISRPTVRRKSSAGLLSSFKSPILVSASQSPTLPQTPSIATTPMPPPANRDWDAQSMYSESAGSVATNTTGSSVPSFQGTSLEFVRDLVQKRIVTLTYMRNTHEGRVHWFQTILITRAELEKVFNNTAMRKRTYKFAILAMSLSNLFDIQTAHDFLRGILGTLAEFDQFQDENFKPKMKLFRFSKPPKRQAGINDFPFPDTSETSYLMTPHIANYHQTLLSLLDILSEVYQKISRILGPSPFQLNPTSSAASTISTSSTAHMMGPLGLLSPHPGVSYLFSGLDASSEGGDTSLWNIVWGNSYNNSSVGSPPPATWTPGMEDTFLKIDGKLKKIMSTLLKELDQLARDEIREELATLDPLLRNVAVADMGREQYDFEVGV